MTFVIITVGLEKGCRQELNRHFKPQRYRIEHRDDNARIFELIRQYPPESL